MTGDNLTPEIIEELAIELGKQGTGYDITGMLQQMKIRDESGQSTKWRCLDWVFNDSLQRTGSWDEVFNFIEHFVPPVKFANEPVKFEGLRKSLNAYLLFACYEYLETGKIRQVEPVKTISEADARLDNVRAKLAGRNIHQQVWKYCRADLMQEDYFDAVFEACKGLMERVREMSGVDADGAHLVQQVFVGIQPKLAFNSLHTDLERGDHRGFAALLEGCIRAVRNRLAHQPKILWEGADDAADYLTLISLLHRKLDQAVPTNLNQIEA